MTEVRWNVVLIYISLIAKDAEHFFMYLLAICISFENSLLSSSAYLFIGLFVLLLFNVLCSL
jgi:hypothetical protein